MQPKFTFLFVEDDAIDRLLIVRAFKKTGLPGIAKCVENGYELRDYLQGNGRFENRRLYPMPDIIVTDLRMPGYNGIELLEWIKTTENLRQIPVFILSATMFEKDFLRARELGVEMYLTKPSDPGEIVDLFRACFRPYVAEQMLQTI